ncbi:uncharacterized protein LOC115313525 isoform X5 [Ixodes scapularis]|uniref:uncharacterized protein LOC115313525 isoform X5 n=1 Tax=Ixodes scapularis TaxID=6945 RepID=UPI001AD7AD3D|nr:uncharacterized protein LOC115313525 isoform X5 [Ixodes scapularis]
MFWLRQNVLPLFEDSPPREGSPGAESFCSALSEGAESFYSALSDQRSTHSVYYDAEASELESSDSDSRYADADEEFAPEQVVVVPDDSDTTASASGVADDDFESFSYGKIFEDVYGSVIHRPPPVKSQRKGDAREKDFGNEPAENLPQRRSFPRGAYRAPATAWMSSELPGQLGFLRTEQPSPSFEQEATERGNTEVLLMSLLEEVADEFAEFIIDEALLEAPKKYGNRLWWNEANDSECETIIKDDNTGVKLLGSRRCLEESQNGHWETFEHGSFVGEEDLEKMSVEERDILDEFDKHFEPCLDSEEEPDSHAFDDVSEEELESWGESEREEKGLLNKNALLGKFKRFPQSGEKKGALNRGHSLSDGSRDGSTPKCFPLPPVPATSSAGELTGNEWRRHSADIVDETSRSGKCMLNGRAVALDHELSASSSVLSLKSLTHGESVPNGTAVPPSINGNESRAFYAVRPAMQARREPLKTIQPTPARPTRKHSYRKQCTGPGLMLAPCPQTSTCESLVHPSEHDHLNSNLVCEQEPHYIGLETAPAQFDRIASDHCVMDKPKEAIEAPRRRRKVHGRTTSENTDSASDALCWGIKTRETVVSPFGDAASRELLREKQEVIVDDGEQRHSIQDLQPVPTKRHSRSKKWTNGHDTTVCHADLSISSTKESNLERPIPPRRHSRRNIWENMEALASPCQGWSAPDEKWSEAPDNARIVHLPFSLSELTGSLFDDNVPLDVVSLKVVDNCDFLKDSDDMSPPYVMKLDPGKDLSAFLVDPDCSEWNRSDDIDCATPEDVSRHALEVDAGLSCASADCESLSSAEQWDSETWIGSPLEGGFQQQQQQQELKDLFEATPPLSHTGSFQGAVTCATDEGRPSLTVQPADNTNLSGEALSGDVARGSGEIPPLHSTSCPPYHDSLPANGGSVAQTNSDCFDVFSETSNTCARAFSSVAALQRDVKDMAPERIDGQAYLETIELASHADLKRYFLEAYDGRPAEGKKSNVRCPQLCGPTDPFEREHLQRHDSQASNASQKKKLVYPRTNDSGKDASCSDSVQKKCELKERSCSPQEPQTWLPLGHSANCLQDLVGRERGIQGHHNSCYLDATLFAMFSCTDVFDSMIHRPKRVSDIDEYSDIQKVLRDDIVNELRRKKFVSHEKVMKLRELLDAQGGVSGLTTEEKDPEEFLNSLFRALGVEPYLKLSSGQGTHLYQLFVEKHELLDEPNIPTVQQLFHHSIHDSNIKLNEIPSALIIQMPRFGKQFKVYPRIIPSLTLDITDALKDSPRSCFVCGRLACKECRDCFRPDVGLEGTSYCSTCSEAVHKHPDRVQHTLSNLKVVEGIGKDSPVQRHYMDLCAVVCIETSHYVCFVKCGQDPDSTWVFFDSMADREGAEDGHNIPEVVVFHDHALWLGNTTPSTLQTALDSKNLGNMSRRLVCDAYMCMYKSNMAAKYS